MPISPPDALPLLAPFVGAVGAGVAALSTKALNNRKARRCPDYQDKTALQLPWLSVLPDKETVRTQRKHLFRVLDLSGISYSGMSDDLEKSYLDLRLRFFRSLKNDPIELRYFLNKRKLVLPTKASSVGFLGRIDDAWNSYMSSVFSCNHQLIFSVENESGYSRLSHITDQAISELAPYKPRLLRNEDGPSSELLTYLSGLVGGFTFPIPCEQDNINWTTGYHDVQWTSKGRGVTSDGLTTKHWAVFSVRELPSYSTPALIDALLNVPGELTLYMHVLPKSIQDASASARYRAKQSSLFQSKELKDEKTGTGESLSSVKKEWLKTSDDLESGKDALLQIEIAVFLLADNQEALTELIRDFRVNMTTQMNKLVYETSLAEDWFFSRFPEYNYFNRPWTIRASNLADWLCFSSDPKGHDRCTWGPHPARYVPTAGTRMPYGFIFQETAADQSNPNFAIFGGVNKGKTTSLMHLITGALSAYPEMFAVLFDQRYGLRVITNALDGEYLMPGYDQLNLNPFDLETDQESAAMLETLFAILADVGSRPEPDKEYKEIQKFVSLILSNDRNSRRLNDDALNSYMGTGKVREALRKWVTSERFGHIFTGEKDCFDPVANRVIGIDMTYVRDDPVLCSALTFYFLRKIHMIIRNKRRPHLILIDESSTLLGNKNFAEKAEEVVRTIRKDEGAIGFAFQEIGGMLDCSIGNTLAVNLGTKLIFPGSAKSSEHCRALNLSESESRFALGHEQNLPSPYTVLLKRDTESVFLDFNMAPLGKLLRFFAGGVGPTERMMSCIKTHGPDNWFDPYANWR